MELINFGSEIACESDKLQSLLHQKQVKCFTGDKVLYIAFSHLNFDKFY